MHRPGALVRPQSNLTNTPQESQGNSDEKFTWPAGVHVFFCWMWTEVIWMGYEGELCFPTAQAVPTHRPQLEARWESGRHRQRGRVSDRPGLTRLIIDHQPVESCKGPTVFWQCVVFRLQNNGFVSVLGYLGPTLSSWLDVTMTHLKHVEPVNQ